MGTFVASVMTHLWLYGVAFDAAEGVLTLDAEGPTDNRRRSYNQRPAFRWHPHCAPPA